MENNTLVDLAKTDQNLMCLETVLCIGLGAGLHLGLTMTKTTNSSYDELVVQESKCWNYEIYIQFTWLNE